MVKNKTEEPSEELLVYISMFKEDEPQEAEEAFNVFYQRFSDFVFKIVYYACKDDPYLDQNFVQTVVNNTFIKVYLRAETFNDGGIQNNPEKMDYRIKSWLSTIAQNEFKQLIKKSIPKENPYISEDIKETYEVVDDSPTSFPRELIDKALKTLDDRQKDILLRYMKFKEGNKKLPDNELEQLATFYNTTSDNIRQIKFRAMKKVKMFIKENSDYEID